MDRVIFEVLRFPTLRYNLDIGSGSPAVQTRAIRAGVENILIHERPYVVLVRGDPNTVLVGTFATSKCYVRGNAKTADTGWPRSGGSAEF